MVGPSTNIIQKPTKKTMEEIRIITTKNKCRKIWFRKSSQAQTSFQLNQETRKVWWNR